MKLAGKSAPEYAELEDVPDELDYLEVYLTPDHVEDQESVDESAESIQNSGYEPVSVHTPHFVKNNSMMPGWQGYLKNTERLANQLDALLVHDSMNLPQLHYAGTEQILDQNTELAYEHKAGISREAVENNILENPKTDGEYGFVFDTAHLFVAHPSSYLDITEEWVNLPQTELIHFNDAIPQQDGKPFGEGDMDMQEVYNAIADSEFDGPVVLEVYPDEQGDALEFVNQWEDERLGSVEGREVA